MAFENKAVSTMRKTAYAVLRLTDFLAGRGRDLLCASEWDMKAYELARTRLQPRPIADRTWDNECVLLDGVFRWLVEQGHRRALPVRAGRRGRNPLLRSVRRGMDVRHLTLGQYRYLRDVGLGGLTPRGVAADRFRGWAPLRGQAAADLALGTGMRFGEWSTLLLPELGLDARRAGAGVVFPVQACAKYGRRREVYVPPGSLDAAEAFVLLERPAMVAAGAARLARRVRELFVVSRVDLDGGRVSGLLEGRRRCFRLEAMGPALRRIAVCEGPGGLEPLAVFVGHGGQMIGATRWAEVRADAWARMRRWADDSTPPLPRRAWRWHDLRHSFALQLLLYLEAQLDGAQSDARLRRARHERYLTEGVARNPLLIVSRRLGHADPSTTYQYLQYLDDPGTYLDAALAGWTGPDSADYAAIGAHVLGLEHRSAVGADGAAG